MLHGAACMPAESVSHGDWHVAVGCGILIKYPVPGTKFSTKFSSTRTKFSTKFSRWNLWNDCFHVSIGTILSISPLAQWCYTLPEQHGVSMVFSSRLASRLARRDDPPPSEFFLAINLRAMQQPGLPPTAVRPY